MWWPAPWPPHRRVLTQVGEQYVPARADTAGDGLPYGACTDDYDDFFRVLHDQFLGETRANPHLQISFVMSGSPYRPVIFSTMEHYRDRLMNHIHELRLLLISASAAPNPPVASVSGSTTPRLHPVRRATVRRGDSPGLSSPPDHGWSRALVMRRFSSHRALR